MPRPAHLHAPWSLATAIAVAAVAIAPASVRGEADPAVSWSAHPPCPGAAQFREALRAELSPSAWSRLPSAAIETNAVTGGYRAEIRLSTGGEGRTLRGRTCEEVLQASVLYLALLADTPPITDRTTIAPASIQRESTRRVHSALAIAAGAALDAGALPDPTPGARLELSWHNPSLHIGVDATYYDQRRQRLAQDSRFGGDFHLWTTGVDSCYRLYSVTWGCGGAELGRVGASGLGGFAPARADTWIAGTLGAAAVVPLADRFEIVAYAGAAAPLRRSSYVVTGLGAIHRSEAVSARLGLSLRARFFYTETGRAPH